jgi:uncharacterized damage-inducible protein DinB
VYSELEGYLQQLEDLHGQIGDLITDLPSQALNWRPTERVDDHATNSLAALATHVAGSEQFWITETVGGRHISRDRAAEFLVEVTDFAELHRLLEKVAVETKEVLSTLSKSDLNSVREVQGKTITVRWCILHVIEHAALHLGHMQLTYQLWTGGKSKLTPSWHQRMSD